VPVRPALSVSLLLLPGLVALTGALSGCGLPTEPQNMGLLPYDQLQLRNFTPEVLRGQVRLGTVAGGAQTSRFWGSKISDEALRIALDDSLRGVGMAALLPDTGRFELQAKLLHLEQPWLAPASAQVALYMEYRLVERATGKLMYQRQMRLAHTTEFSAAMLDPNERLRLANEAALRRSINALLRELVELPIS